MSDIILPTSLLERINQLETNYKILNKVLVFLKEDKRNYIFSNSFLEKIKELETNHESLNSEFLLLKTSKEKISNLFLNKVRKLEVDYNNLNKEFELLKNNNNLPDSFVEKVKTLEIKQEIFQKEHDNLVKDFNRIKLETKRSRLFWNLLDNLPISPGFTLSILTGFTFVVAFITEIVVRVTVVDDWIQKLFR